MSTGASVAAAFVAAMARDGLTPDPALRLLGWLDPSTSCDPDTIPPDPFGLGLFHEHAETDADRVRRGAWYTPRWLADDLVARAFDATRISVRTVADLSCGGGAFLLAAAERLATTAGVEESVRSLWGCDVDPVAVAVSEASLWWWSAVNGAPTVIGDRLVVGDALVGTPIPRASVVVGNPPFLGQLRTSTASDAARRASLRSRFGDVVRPYTDVSWLFLLAAVASTDPGGAVALVQPSSVLGARDAGPIRRAIDAAATFVDTWIDDGRTFGAAVEGCAPVLRVGDGAANDWTAPLAAAQGIPDSTLASSAVLGDVATVLAGFRDEYYGLVDAVAEGGSGPRLLTSGSIDPLRHRPGHPVRFAKRRWHDPRVDPVAATGRAVRWLDEQRGPKLVVATQTRVIEAIVDADSTWVASVPSIVVRPDDPDDLWLLAAALHAPVISAWMLRRSAGTALSNDACKPTSALLSALPLPSDREAWTQAAVLAERVASGDDCWEDLGRIADRAYGVVDAATLVWWRERLPLR